MFINVSEYISTPLKSKTYEVPLDMQYYDHQGTKYPFKDQGVLKLTVSNSGNRTILLKGEWQGSLVVPCDRCLKDVIVPFDVVIDREVDFTKIQDDTFDDDSSSYIVDNSIDTDALINHEILIHFPMKILCREDCKGICLKCGKDLNLGECGCDRKVLDPRMAAIQDIFKNFKEV